MTIVIAHEPEILPQVRVMQAHPSERFELSGAATIPSISISGEDGLLTFGTAPLPEPEPWWRRIAPSTLYALLAGLIGVFFLIHELLVAGSPGFPIDQAWVQLVYAKHFFHNISFEFNPGERTTGPAGPLWTVFLAFGLPLFKDPFVTAKLLGSIFLFLTGYYSFRLLRAIEFDYGSALIGGVLAMTIPRLCWAEFSGVEATLSSALVLAALWAYLSQDGRLRKYLTGILFGIALFARPETALVFALVLSHWTVMHFLEHFGRRESRSYSNFWKEIGSTIGVYFLIVLPLLITNQALAGSVLPPSFLAALTNKSLLILILNGDIGGLLQHIALSAVAIPATTWTVFVRDEPFLLVAILWAAVELLRQPRHEADANEHFFTLGVLVLFFFPYFHALLLGPSGEYGEAAHSVLFLSPIYLLTGISAIRIVVERYALRGPTSRTILLIASLIALVSGLATMVASDTLVDASIATRFAFHALDTHNPILAIAFVLLLLLATSFAFKYEQSSEQGTRRYAHDPREFEKLTYRELRPNESLEEKLPKQTIKLLRGIFIVCIAWNAALLPEAAHEYSARVRANNSDVQVVKHLGEIAEPGSVIATNRPGIVSWFSGHYVAETEGILSPDLSRLQWGETVRNPAKVIDRSHALYFVAFGNEYRSFVQHSLSNGYFQEIPSSTTSRGEAALYRIDTARVAPIQY